MERKQLLRGYVSGPCCLRALTPPLTEVFQAENARKKKFQCASFLPRPTLSDVSIASGFFVLTFFRDDQRYIYHTLPHSDTPCGIL